MLVGKYLFGNHGVLILTWASRWVPLCPAYYLPILLIVLRMNWIKMGGKVVMDTIWLAAMYYRILHPTFLA